MKIIKKNQIVIFVIALMLITAGYLNYTAEDKDSIMQASSESTNTEEIAALGDARLVSSNSKDEIKEEASSINLENNQNINEETKQTSAKASKQSSDDYFTNSRLTRDTMYSQMIESYQKILDNTAISADQKGISQTEIKKINNLKNSIMICENIIKTKGFSDVVVFVNDKSINVIVKKENMELTGEEAAQIQNIVAREMNAEVENIHISCK